MIAVTPRAAQHLVDMRSQRGLTRTGGARFIPMSNGVGMAIVGGAKPGDKVIPANGIEIYAGPETARRVEGSTLDVEDKAGRAALVLRTRQPTRIDRTRIAAPEGRWPAAAPSRTEAGGE